MCLYRVLCVLYDVICACDTKVCQRNDCVFWGRTVLTIRSRNARERSQDTWNKLASAVCHSLWAGGNGGKQCCLIAWLGWLVHRQSCSMQLSHIGLKLCLHTFFKIGIKRFSSSSTASRVDLHHSANSLSPMQRKACCWMHVTAADHLVFESRKVCNSVVWGTRKW